MVQEIHFDKMHGLGNDYVYIVCMKELPGNLPELAIRISDRHFGVGGDGLVVVTESDVADFKMIMFNNDGSEAQMCGNASRCIGKLVYESGLTEKTKITLETGAGIKHLELHVSNKKVNSVSVNMGKPYLSYADIPVVRGEIQDRITKHKIILGGKELELYCIGMGNPHGVIFDKVSEDFFKINSPLLEKHEIWPEKANIEFVNVTGDREIEMRVWERGTGETLACGTGACASAVASILLGKTQNNISVKMKGGNLYIRINDEGEVIMTGEAEHVAKGIYFYNK